MYALGSMTTVAENPDVANPESPAPANRRTLAVRLETGDEIINRAEFARRLGVTERHVDFLIRSKRVHFLRVGGKMVRFQWPRCLESLMG